MGSFLAETEGFTPVIDVVAKDVGLMSAVVYGVVWRYCQMENKVCSASIQTIADRVGISRKTAERHIKALVEAGYLRDLTPSRKNAPHQYADVGKVKIKALVAAKSESLTNRDEVGQSDGAGESQSQSGSDTKTRQGKSQSQTKIPSEESREETTKDSPEYSTPTCFGEWLVIVKNSDNRVAVLRRMLWELYPDSFPTRDDLPTFGYVGKTAKAVGGAGRCAELLWQHCTRPPTGDILAYVQGVAKRSKAEAKSEPAGFPGIRDWLADEGAEVPA